MPFEIGQIIGDYEIVDALGKGGMGCVYRVRNVISNRVEAMKVLLDDLAAEPELGDRFNSEIRTLARLDHPNIAKLHTAIRIGNQLVMIMEFVEGVTLAGRMKQGPVPLGDVLSYVTQVLAALSYAHANGVIHRDIKPSNIMVTSQGIVKLMDFGIAKSDTDNLLTRPGTTMGSLLYISPEQVRGTSVDARSDVYSTGIVLYELSTGRRPFEAENTFAILQAQLNAIPEPPAERNAALPDALNDIIMTALAKEPAHRFQSADAFRNALDGIRGRQGIEAGTLIQHSTVQEHALPRVAAPTKNGRRGLWMAAGATACVCVLVGAVTILPHFWRSAAHVATRVDHVTPTPEATLVVTPAQPAAQPSAVPPPVASTVAAPNQIDNSVDKTVAQPASGSRKKETKLPPSSVKADQYEAAVPPPLQPLPTSPPAQTGVAVPLPTEEEMEKISDDLSKLRARADAVNGSLNALRQQQAAEGLGIRQDIAAAASRLEAYLQAADRAVQSRNSQSARKNMDRADQDLSTLEAFLGR